MAGRSNGETSGHEPGGHEPGGHEPGGQGASQQGPPGRGEVEAGPSTLHQRLAARRVLLEAENGERYLLRPIEPGDAPSLIRGFKALSPRDRWFRMLYAMPELSVAAARRFCAPDPVLDICLVLEGRGDLAGDIVGGARITGDRIIEEPEGRAGEFSVSMRPEMQGQGLARQALAIALQAAAEAGYGRVYGYVAARNRAMLGMAAKLGFTIRFDPDDFTQRIAEISLPACRPD